MPNQFKIVTIVCESCKASFEIDDPKLFGEDVGCPECGATMYVPLPETNDEKIGIAPQEIASKPLPKKPSVSPPANNQTAKPGKPVIQNVAVVDIQMPFMSMVTFMVKWSIASIPAVIIIFALFGFLGMVAGILFGSLIKI